MNGNIKVGNLFGIPFFVNPSWFFVLGLVTLSYGAELSQFPQLNGVAPWLLGFVAALLLFASVLAHELGHSFVALSQGIEVKSITLFIFGGLAQLEKESDTPLKAFLVAIAGPLVSFLLFFILSIIGINSSLSAPLAAVVSLLASINLVLALFNLIPGLPLDGGNILKAAVWQITGNPNQGIIFASRVGQLFGWLAVTVGILGVFRILPFGSIWTLLIGGFLLQNAGFSAQYAKVQEKLSAFTASDAVSRENPLVSSSLTLREFANNYVIGQDKWQKFLAIDEAGKLVGAIAPDDLRQIPTSKWTEFLVKELLQPVAANTIVSADLSLIEVVKLIETQNLQQLIVVRNDGVLVGLLEKAAIVNLLQQKGNEVRATKFEVQS
ncbi:MAG: site-2 protease family protein [Xenococcaceae cyanobacterium]